MKFPFIGVNVNTIKRGRESGLIPLATIKLSILTDRFRKILKRQKQAYHAHMSKKKIKKT